MGQYWIPVNLDKKEFIHPHKLGSGLKLWEMLAAQYVGSALIILTAAYRECRGGGDLDLEKNWHGPERTIPPHNMDPGPMPEDYPVIAKRTIGRWAGDKITIVGNYAEDTDLPRQYKASKIYEKTCNEYEYYTNNNPNGAIYKNQEGLYEHRKLIKASEYLDITDDVCRVIEHELNGKFTGDGWRTFKYTDSDEEKE